MTICLNTFNGYDGFFIHLIIRAIFKIMDGHINTNKHNNYGFHPYTIIPT